MKSMKIGIAFEKKAKHILQNEGFQIIEESSRKNWGSPYDFIVSKNNREYYVEVKGSRENNRFSLGRSKFAKLQELDKRILIVLIKGDDYTLFFLDPKSDKTHGSPYFGIIGARIRSYRKKAGFTLDSLATTAGLTSGKYLGKIERGEVNATLKTLENISVKIGIGIEDLFPRKNADDEVTLELLDIVNSQSPETKARVLRVVKAMLE